jgi:hypothetical protein
MFFLFTSGAMSESRKPSQRKGHLHFLRLQLGCQLRVQATIPSDRRLDEEVRAGQNVVGRAAGLQA